MAGLQRVSLADIAVYNNCTYIRAMDETPMQTRAKPSTAKLSTIVPSTFRAS